MNLLSMLWMNEDVVYMFSTVVSEVMYLLLYDGFGFWESWTRYLWSV